MKWGENSATSQRFRLPRKNSCQETSRFSMEMIESNVWRNPTTLSLSLSLGTAPILQRLKEGYLVWLAIVPHMSKGSRYTIGTRIEERFLDLLELTYTAYFTAKEQKSEKLAECILTLDTVKFLISVAWEGKLISHKHYEDVALKLDEVGKMFGGWRKSLANPDKKNHTL